MYMSTSRDWEVFDMFKIKQRIMQCAGSDQMTYLSNKVEKHNILYTLCNENKVGDEDHIVSMI